MLISLFILVGGISIASLLLGYLVVKNGRGGSAFKIGGYIIMLLLGSSVLASGLTVESGVATLNTTGGVTTVTPTYESISWSGLGLGVPLILFGLLGIILSIVEQKDSQNPYHAGGMRPPA